VRIRVGHFIDVRVSVGVAEAKIHRLYRVPQFRQPSCKIEKVTLAVDNRISGFDGPFI